MRFYPAVFLPLPALGYEDAAPAVLTSITVVGRVETESPGNISVIQGDDLAASPGAGLDERLRDVPGFSLFRRSSSLVAHPTAQGVSSTMLMLAAIGLVLPALASHVLQFEDVESLSLGISVVLIVTYVCSLLFSLRTHKHLYDCAEDPEECKPHWPIKYAAFILTLATIAVAVESEILVGSIEHVSQSLGFTELFIGVIVVAIIGNAAEHSTAILMALKNKMDLSMGIAMGSSTQIALLIAPALVFISWLMGTPMNLVFNEFEVVAVIAAVVIADMISTDGESNWLEGIQLIALYLMMAVVFFFIKTV
jgi:Ca2+:H+ antiporter